VGLDRLRSLVVGRKLVKMRCACFWEGNKLGQRTMKAGGALGAGEVSMPQCHDTVCKRGR